MTWSPPIESGLSGDAYPTEQIEAFVDSLDDAHRPGVYALKLSQPQSLETAVRRYQEHFDPTPPEWLMGGWSAGALLYVGAAKDVLDRLEQHANGEKSSAITRVFPVHSLYDVWWFDDVDRAFERESGIALKLKNLGDVYVHQR